MIDQLNSALKTILHSKRANIYYLEKCRLMVKDGRVVYLTQHKHEKSYWNIPIANTTVVLLGSGTSITQQAVRMLAVAGVLVGFSGGGGTPLYAGCEIEWLCPQSEYRPTEYVQGWLSFWFDEKKRFDGAKYFQQQRINFIKKSWKDDNELQQRGFYVDDYEIENALQNFQKGIASSNNVKELFAYEAAFTKAFYRIAANKMKYENFTRERASDDHANQFLDQGNYLAYGLGAITLWVLGIPHGFALLHGKTRRGALVFDVADLIKDAIILPWAFICAKEGANAQEFRQQCLQNFIKYSALDFMFEQVKSVSLQEYSL